MRRVRERGLVFLFLLEDPRTAEGPGLNRICRCEKNGRVIWKEERSNQLNMTCLRTSSARLKLTADVRGTYVVFVLLEPRSHERLKWHLICSRLRARLPLIGFRVSWQKVKFLLIARACVSVYILSAYAWEKEERINVFYCKETKSQTWIFVEKLRNLQNYLLDHLVIKWRKKIRF